MSVFDDARVANLYSSLLQANVRTLGPDSVGVGRRYLLFIDLLLVWFSAGAARVVCIYGARFAPLLAIGTTQPPAGLVGFLFLFSILVVLFINIHGLYACAWKRSFAEEAKYLAESIGCAAVVLTASLYLVGTQWASILLVVPTIVFSWITIAAWRRFLHSQEIPGLSEKRNVLIVGGGRTAKQLKAHLDSHPELGFVVKGFLDRRQEDRSAILPDEKRSTEFLGNVRDLAAIVRTHFIDEVLLCVPNDRRLVMAVAKYAQGTRVQVRVIPDLYEGLAATAPVEYLGQFPTMTLQKSSIPSLPLIFKRIVDILVSAILLVLLIPVLLIVALAVRLNSTGPIFYRSIRVGRKGETFTCYKFRTMVENADALQKSLAHLNERDGVLFKIAKDPRITSIGRFLRKYSLDELPQLFNVLRGNMSLVGPRPPVPGEYRQYALSHLCRLDVKPGITGLWQVLARQNPSFEQYIELDREYVERWSFWLDCRILLKTVGAVAAGTGR